MCEGVIGFRFVLSLVLHRDEARQGKKCRRQRFKTPFAAIFHLVAPQIRRLHTTPASSHAPCVLDFYLQNTQSLSTFSIFELCQKKKQRAICLNMVMSSCWPDLERNECAQHFCNLTCGWVETVDSVISDERHAPRSLSNIEVKAPGVRRASTAHSRLAVRFGGRKCSVSVNF